MYFSTIKFQNWLIIRSIGAAILGNLLIGVFFASSQPTDMGSNQMITLAVMDFKNTSSDFSLDRLERNVPEMLKTELSQSGRIIVVERQRLETILAEQALGQSGVLDDEKAQKVGQVLGAQYIINGEITLAGQQLRIDSHILKVETGQVTGEKVIGEGTDVLNEMVQLLSRNIIYDLTGVGSKATKITLGKMPTKWFLGATALSAIGLGVTHSSYRKYYDDYSSATKLDEFDSNYDKANRYRKGRDVLVGTTSALALTTFILWLVEKSSVNDIVASNDSNFDCHQKKFAVGMQHVNDAYCFSFRYHF